MSETCRILSNLCVTWIDFISLLNDYLNINSIEQIACRHHLSISLLYFWKDIFPRRQLRFAIERERERNLLFHKRNRFDEMFLTLFLAWLIFPNLLRTATDIKFQLYYK